MLPKTDNPVSRLTDPALDKYFWDHTQNASDAFRLKRLLEYAGFPDLLKVPFDFVKQNIRSIDSSRLRTSEVRKRFVKRISGVVDDCNNWEEAVYKITGIL